MNKKQFTIICILLALIVLLLVFLIYQNNQFMQYSENAFSNLSDKIDILTGKVNDFK